MNNANLFRINTNFVKTDTVRNATHITRCSFLPPCIFLSSHLLFCRFTPFLLYQPKPLFILYSYKDVKSDKKEIQWWNFTMGWNIFSKKNTFLFIALLFLLMLIKYSIWNFFLKKISNVSMYLCRKRWKCTFWNDFNQQWISFNCNVFFGKVYWKNIDTLFLFAIYLNGF